MKSFRFILILLLGTAATVLAQDKPSGKFSGYMFGDYYWIAKNHDTDIEKMNGFWLRRVYFTYDKTLSDAFSTRLRLEMGHPGDFETSGKAEPFVKDAYLKWKKGNTQLLLGISSTPTWDVIEKTWGYRSVEKTLLDLQKFASSRDFGIAVKGNLDQAGKVKYHVMVGNGNSNKSETNKGKKAMLSLGFYPSKEVIIEFYGDLNDNPGDTNWITVQGFAAYNAKQARLGVQFAHQTRNVESGEDLTFKLGSVFFVTKVGEKTNLFARVDRMFDPNPSGSKISYIPFSSTAKSTFFVGGLDIMPIKDVHLMPNIEFVTYDEIDGGEKPDSDVIPRFSFYYKF